MSILTDTSKSLKAYRLEAAKLHDYSLDVEKKLEEAGASGDLTEARLALSELKIKTKAFEELRATLSPLERFIAKYGVVAINDHSVSFVLPQGVSRIELLKEAQELSIGLYEENRDQYNRPLAIRKGELEKWESLPHFIEVVESTTLLKINGRVEGSTNMSRQSQEAEGWNNVTQQDLAVAHTVFYLLTGQDLFQGKVVRAAGGVLKFGELGLVSWRRFDDGPFDTISASSHLPI